MSSVLWTLLGFVAGLLTAGFAIELGLKKLFRPPETSKLTGVWSLTELPSPLIAATNANGVKVPSRARLVTAQTFTGAREGFDLRKNVEVTGSFAVDANVPRAILFLGDVRPGAMALWTVDEKLIERLRAEFTRLWSRSTDHVERVTVAQIASKPNLTVQTEGTVQDVLPYRGQYMLRLADAGDAVGVMVDRDLPVRGKKVTVTGVVRVSSSGYPMVEALEVEAVT